MSVVVGCSLFHRVMLAADARATVMVPGSPTIYVDNVQKLLPLTDKLAIGFVGDIPAAASLLKAMDRQLRKWSPGKRLHPVAFLNWFPRFLRFKYDRVLQVSGARPVAFIVAASLVDRPNVVERSRVVELMERFRLGQLSMQRNWMPEILVRIMMMPASAEHIVLTDLPRGILCALRCPDFVPQFVDPLRYVALGSGETITEEMARVSDWVFAGNVGNSFMEVGALQDAVLSFIDRAGISTIGGMVPVIRVDLEGVTLHGYRVTMPVGGRTIELTVTSQGGWVQRNAESGREIPLLPPWEIDLRTLLSHTAFNDLRDMFREFRGSNVDRDGG